MGGPQHLVEELCGGGAGFGTDFHQAAEHPVVRLKPAPDTVDRLPGCPERTRLSQGFVDVMTHGIAGVGIVEHHDTQSHRVPRSARQPPSYRLSRGNGYCSPREPPDRQRANG